jgi:hypothetical protein
VREHQERWLHREFESDDPHIWQRNNAAALGYAGAMHDLKIMLEELSEQPIKEKSTNEE